MTNLCWNPTFEGHRGVLSNMTHRTPVAPGWLFGTDGGGAKFEASWDDDAPDDSVPGSLKVECTTAQSSPVALSDKHLRFAIDGADLWPYRNSDIPIKMDVMLGAPGYQCLSFNNEDRSRTFAREFAVPTPHVWQTLETTLPFGSRTGVWSLSGGRYGMGMRVPLVIGSSYQVAKDQYVNGNYLGTANQTNLGSAVGNYIKIAKVVIGDVPAFIVPPRFEVLMRGDRQVRVIENVSFEGGVGVNIPGSAGGEIIQGSNLTDEVNFDLWLAAEMDVEPEIEILGAVNTDWNLQTVTGTNITTSATIKSYRRSRSLAKFTVKATSMALTAGERYILRLRDPSAKMIINGAW